MKNITKSLLRLIPIVIIVVIASYIKVKNSFVMPLDSIIVSTNNSQIDFYEQKKWKNLYFSDISKIITYCPFENEFSQFLAINYDNQLVEYCYKNYQLEKTILYESSCPLSKPLYVPGTNFVSVLEEISVDSNKLLLIDLITLEQIIYVTDNITIYDWLNENEIIAIRSRDSNNMDLYKFNSYNKWSLLQEHIVNFSLSQNKKYLFKVSGNQMNQGILDSSEIGASKTFSIDPEYIITASRPSNDGNFIVVHAIYKKFINSNQNINQMLGSLFVINTKSNSKLMLPSDKIFVDNIYYMPVSEKQMLEMGFLERQ